MSAYRPDLDNWTSHIALPIIAYRAIYLGAIALPGRSTGSGLRARGWHRPAHFHRHSQRLEALPPRPILPGVGKQVTSRRHV